jgi:hypothetical protein
MKLTSYKCPHEINQDTEMQTESTADLNSKVLTYIVVLTVSAMQ